MRKHSSGVADAAIAGTASGKIKKYRRELCLSTEHNSCVLQPSVKQADCKAVQILNLVLFKTEGEGVCEQTSFPLKSFASARAASRPPN